MKTSLSSCYEKIKEMRGYSPEEIAQWQDLRVRKLLHHAYFRTRYYRKLFDELGLHPDDIKSRDDVNKLPILDKSTVLAYFDQIISDNIDYIPHKVSATGGSTGDPMPYLLDHDSWSFSNANSIINWEKTGYKYGDKYLALGSTSLFINKKESLKHKIYYALKNKVARNGINMSESVCMEYMALIKKKKIRFIYGYASSIYLLAKHVLEQNEKVRLVACITTAEILTDQYRKTISEAFQCKILDAYGAHDGGITAFSHEKGFYETGYNCLVRVEKKEINGQGAALLTDLTNFAMPLINYKLGDELQIDDTKNAGYPYNGQIINKVLGRTSDIIELENGSTLTGPGFTILFKDLPVEHYCIEKTDVNEITCSIIKLPQYDQGHENLIRSTFIKHIGEDAGLRIEYMTEVPLTNSGKRVYFKK